MQNHAHYMCPQKMLFIFTFLSPLCAEMVEFGTAILYLMHTAVVSLADVDCSVKSKCILQCY